MINARHFLLMLLMFPLFLSAQEIRLAEKLTMQTPEGITPIENSYQFSKSRGYCDNYIYTVYIIPLETEMPDGNKGAIADRYKNLKTMDTIFVNKKTTQLLETQTEKFYQWTKDYVKKKYETTDSSKWKYVYTFASHTNTEIVLVVVETTHDDNYATIDSILSTFEYKPGFWGKFGHGWQCAELWWFLLIIILIFSGFIVFVDHNGTIWPFIYIICSAGILLFVTEGDFVMILSFLVIAGGGLLLGWLEDR